MSGMQDVATLAERYNNLSSNAEKLQKSIVRLKKEVSYKYNVLTGILKVIFFINLIHFQLQ